MFLKRAIFQRLLPSKWIHVKGRQGSRCSVAGEKHTEARPDRVAVQVSGLGVRSRCPVYVSGPGVRTR